MSDGATPPLSVADPPDPAADAVGVPAVPGWPVVLAHLAGGVSLGAVSGFLILWTSPGVRLGVSADGFDITDLAPALVALAALGIALVTRLRPYAWLVAAVGLLGFAGLYLQGSRLDGRSLVIALVVVIALQFGGMLLAFAEASGRARWAVAVGLGAGIAAGRDVLAWLVDAVRQGPLPGTGHADAVVFAGLGVVMAAAGVVVLWYAGARPVRSDPAGSGPAAARWPLVGVAGASVLATGLTEAWDGAFRDMTMSHIGGISEADARALQTTDHLARVGLGVLVTAALAAAAYRWGGRAAARWVATGFGAALLLAVLQAFLAYRVTVPAVALAAAGALAGALLARRAAPRVPWEAVGLALGSCLALVDSSSWLWPVGWFGFGFAVSAGATALAGSGAGSPDRAGPGSDRAAPAAGFGLAALLLGYHVVAPASVTGARVGLPVVAGGVFLAAAAVVFVALVRRPHRGR